MFGFIKYVWKNYQRQRKLDYWYKQGENMIRDMKIMPTKDFKDKYGNPSKRFVEIKWEIIKLKRRD